MLLVLDRKLDIPPRHLRTFPLTTWNMLPSLLAFIKQWGITRLLPFLKTFRASRLKHERLRHRSHPRILRCRFLLRRGWGILVDNGIFNVLQRDAVASGLWTNIWPAGLSSSLPFSQFRQRSTIFFTFLPHDTRRARRCSSLILRV